MRKLGPVQRRVLETLIERHGWYPGCGWVWENLSSTIKILESLVARGLVERTLIEGGTGTHSHYKVKVHP